MTGEAWLDAKGRQRLTCRLAMSCLLALSVACANASLESVQETCNEFERAVSEGRSEACQQARTKCLTAINKATRQRTRELRALQSKVGSDVNREHTPNPILARSITVLEQELADLAAKEEKIKATECGHKD